MLSKKPQAGSLFYDNSAPATLSSPTASFAVEEPYPLPLDRQRQRQKKLTPPNPSSSLHSPIYHAESTGNLNFSQRGISNVSYGGAGYNRGLSRAGAGQDDHDDGHNDDDEDVITAPLSSAVAAPLTISDLSRVGGGMYGSPPRGLGSNTYYGNFNSNSGSNATSTNFGSFDTVVGKVPASAHRGTRAENTQEKEDVTHRLRELEDDIFMRKPKVTIDEDPQLHFEQVVSSLQTLPKSSNAVDPPWWLSRYTETTAALRRPYAEEEQKRRALERRVREASSKSPPNAKRGSGSGSGIGGRPIEDFTAFAEDNSNGPPKAIIVRDPIPSSVGMLRGQQDLALPPPKPSGGSEGSSSVTPQKRSARGSVHLSAVASATFGKGGGGGSNKASNTFLRADFETSGDGDETLPFAVERQYRNKDHVRLQQIMYPPLRTAAGHGVADDMTAAGAREGVSSEVGEVLRRYRASAATTSSQQSRGENGGMSPATDVGVGRPRDSSVDRGVYVPFSVRPLGHGDLKYSADDARRRAEELTENNRRRAVEDALDVTTATVATEPYRPPPPRNLREEEEAKRKLVAFDDDDAFTFQARRLRNTAAVDDLFSSAASETVQRAEEGFQRAQDEMFAAMSAAMEQQHTNAGGGRTFGGTFAGNPSMAFAAAAAAVNNGSFAPLTNMFNNMSFMNNSFMNNNPSMLFGGIPNNMSMAGGGGGGPSFADLMAANFGGMFFNNSSITSPNGGIHTNGSFAGFALESGGAGAAAAGVMNFKGATGSFAHTHNNMNINNINSSFGGDAYGNRSASEATSGGGGGGGGFVSLQQRFLNLLTTNAMLPPALVIGDAAYVFAHDFTFCMCFRPADRSPYNDEWRTVSLSCDSVVTETRVKVALSGYSDAGVFHDEEDGEEDEELRDAEDMVGRTSSSNVGGTTRYRSFLAEEPQLPPPKSFPVPFFHPKLQAVLFAVSPDGSKIFGCCVSPRPMQGYSGGCWKSMRVLGLDQMTGGGGFGQRWNGNAADGGIVWAHVVDNSTLYVQWASHKHFTVSIGALIDELMKEHATSSDILGLIAGGGDRETDGNGTETLGKRKGTALLSRLNKRESGAREHIDGEQPGHDGEHDSGGQRSLPSHAVPATHRNLVNLRPGNLSRYGGLIIDDTTSGSRPEARATFLKSNPPEEALTALPYPGVAYSTHPRERKDRVTGEVLSEEQYRQHDILARQHERVSEELSKLSGGAGSSAQRSIPVGFNVFSKYGLQTQKPTDESRQRSVACISESGHTPFLGSSIDKRGGGGVVRSRVEDDEIGEYYFDYDLNRYVQKQKNIKNRNILLTEAHTWVWLFNPAARNFVPWTRLDGVFDPLTVALHNHLRGPDEVATLGAETLTTFFFSEETIRVGRDLGDPRSHQEFLKVKAKVTALEAPPPHQIALFEKERKREEANKLRTMSGSGGTARMSELHVKEQMLRLKDQRLRSAQKAGRDALAKERKAMGIHGDETGEDDSIGAYHGMSNNYMGKLAPHLLQPKPDAKAPRPLCTTNNAATTREATDETEKEASAVDPYVAAARALATKPLIDRVSCEKALSRLDASLHIKARRQEIALAIPMTNRRAAILSSDFRSYVVVELDRYTHAKKYRSYANSNGEEEEVLEL